MPRARVRRVSVRGTQEYRVPKISPSPSVCPAHIPRKMNIMCDKLWPLLACLWLAAAGAGATSGTGSHAHHASKPLFPGTYSLTWAALKKGCSVSGDRGRWSGHSPVAGSAAFRGCIRR